MYFLEYVIFILLNCIAKTPPALSGFDFNYGLDILANSNLSS